MNNRTRYFLILVIVAAVAYVGMRSFSPALVPYSDARIEYQCRMGINPDSTAKEIYWSGSSVKIAFKGTGIKALLKDENGNNYFNIIIDNDSSYLLRPDTSKQLYALVSGLKKGNHTVEIFKRNEWDRGKTLFYGFAPEPGTTILKTKKSAAKKIEIYGNSVSAGMAVEDFTGKDSGDSSFTNNYRSYSAITIRHFKADYSNVVRSGIGVLISWFPIIMPELYGRCDPLNPQSTWDFSAFTPDVVIINLFQNDSWLVNRKDYPEFTARFGTTPPTPETIIAAYQAFVKKIRSHYPKAQIICMLGNMDITHEGSVWPGYVLRAVEGLNDPDIHTLFVPYKKTGGHPTAQEQQVLADSLIAFMEKTLGW
jgi:hypothetical protein